MSASANANAGRSGGDGTGGGRSEALEMHRREGSAGGGVGEGWGGANRGHGHVRTMSSGSGSVKGGGEGRGTTYNGTPGVGVGAVAPPPKERLLPSPPLTPVASIESLRKDASTIARDGNVTPKSGKSNERVTGDRRTSSSIGIGGTAVDRSAGGLDVGGGDGEVTVDTEGDGAVSTWSFRPDGDRETSGQDERANAFGGDYTRDGLLAQPSGVTAIPQSPTGDKRDDGIPQGLTTPEEERDPLRGSDVNAPAPQSFLGIFPFAGDSSSSAMPPTTAVGHETLANSKFPSDSRHLHPLQDYSPPSPQPWDLVSPPPGNNDPMGERMRRTRKESNRTVLGSSADIVVKDGKKYRIPHSSYYFGPPPDTSAFGTDPIGHIGVHHPREIVRIERDYSGGELCQFSPAYPLELEGRITPTQFLETVNAINETLIDAHSVRWSFLDNALAVFTLYISRLFVRSHYDRSMKRLKDLIEGLNKQLYNPAGLNILWPKDVAFMFLEIEYY